MVTELTSISYMEIRSITPCRAIRECLWRPPTLRLTRYLSIILTFYKLAVYLVPSYIMALILFYF